jgi:murein L,D-transpeptidase YafK
MKCFFILIFILSNLVQATELTRFDEVKVYKSKHRMDMLLEGKIVKSYHVMLGKGGKGPKVQAGDNLVPEGHYILDDANPYSKFFRSIHINYPSQKDIDRAAEAGVDPGKDIFLHGLPNDFNAITDWLRKHHLERFGENIIRRFMVFFDWTAGCVAVKDKDIAEIYDHYEGPTPITIYH